MATFEIEASVRFSDDTTSTFQDVVEAKDKHDALRQAKELAQHLVALARRGRLDDATPLFPDAPHAELQRTAVIHDYFVNIDGTIFPTMRRA